MLDISNKLHAMVDEFVSNLTSECASLVHNVPSQVHGNVANDSRPGNRTTQEVLKGLRRPSESNVADYPRREGKSHMEHAKSNMLEGDKKYRDNGRSSRQSSELRSKTASLEGVDNNKHSESVPIHSNSTVTKAKVKQGRPTKGVKAKGKFSHTVEILSSDHSSNDCPIAIIKSTKKKVGKQSVKKLEPSPTRGVSTGVGIRSPLISQESSHVMNYSFKEDTQSLDSKNPPPETPFPKLRLPEDVGDVPEDERTWKGVKHNKAETYSKSHTKHEKKICNEETSLEEGDESNDEDVEPQPNGRESDAEELHVLPRVPVKRKLVGEPRGSERRIQRSGTKISSPQLKKQRTPQIDASCNNTT